MPNNRSNSLDTIPYLQSGTADPRVIHYDAVAGTFYLQVLPGSVAIYQKQDNGATANWDIFTPGGGGGGATWGAPANTILLAASGPIAVGKNAVRANAAGGALLLTLPAPALATCAVAVSKIDATTNPVVINSGGGATFGGNALANFPIIPQQNQSAIFVPDAVNNVWTAF